MDNVQNLLNEVNAKIKALETAKALYGEQLAPNFLVFDFVNTNETELSRILANLLNPNGTHGQKTLFLENFIKICLPNIHNHENKIWQNYLANLSKTDVETEKTTTAIQSYRRMDIYLSAKINNETFGICIENKPYASDQQDQLADYFKELENRNLTHKHIVYLSEYGEPSDNSVKSDVLEIWRNEKVFSHVTYTQLVEWLSECKKDCQNQSVIEFLNQFIKFIQKQFMGVEDMNEQNEILETIKSSSENIESAIKISSNIFEMKVRLINELFENLESLNKNNNSKSEGKFPKYDLVLGEMKGRVDDKILFGIPNSKLTISFAFNGSGFNFPYIGIFLPDTNLEKENVYADKVFKGCYDEINNPNISIKSDLAWKNGSWLVWYYFDKPNWYNESKFWSEIGTQRLAQDILDEVNKIYKILEINKLLTVEL